MTRYLDLAEYLSLAEQVTGVEASVLAKASRLELAESALYAPAASFGGEEFYPDLFDKPPFSRAGWPGTTHCRTGTSAPLVMFLELNGGAWDPDRRRRRSVRAMRSQQVRPGRRSVAARNRERRLTTLQMQVRRSRSSSWPARDAGNRAARKDREVEDRELADPRTSFGSCSTAE